MGVRKCTDFFRAKITWKDDKDKKYHLARWVDVLQPKKQGVLGILNLDLMNKKPCLLIGVDIRYRRGAMAIYFFLFGVKHKVGDS